MGAFTVVARADGRGGLKPFGTYGAKQAGAMVRIGDKDYKVTTDGRVNIPKSIMDTYGELNKQGRRVINIKFKTAPGKDHWKQVDAEIKRPDKSTVGQRTGSKPRKMNIKDYVDELQPKDSNDGSWSPN